MNDPHPAFSHPLPTFYGKWGRVRDGVKAEDRHFRAIFLFALRHLYLSERRDAAALRFVLLSIMGTTSSSIRMAVLEQARPAGGSITQIELAVNSGIQA